MKCDVTSALRVTKTGCTCPLLRDTYLTNKLGKIPEKVQTTRYTFEVRYPHTVHQTPLHRRSIILRFGTFTQQTKPAPISDTTGGSDCRNIARVSFELAKREGGLLLGLGNTFEGKLRGRAERLSGRNG
jgi:hypothetical protein